MKNISTTLLLIIGFTFPGLAQIALPYNNGFDSAGENADWVLYRQGLTMVNGSPSHAWEPFPSGGAATPPNYLFHEYPIGYTGTQMTDDWLVSKSINFSSGAKLSLKMWIYGIVGLTVNDSVEVYLLTGSQDPAVATKTKIASLRDMVTTAGSNNSPVWSDTAGIVIPATSQTAYIAFRYTTIDNWFTAAIDNLKLEPNANGVADLNGSKAEFRLYPNPAGSAINWELTPGEMSRLQNQEGVIFNLAGQVLQRFPMKEGSADIRELKPGMYFMKMGDTTARFTKL